MFQASLTPRRRWLGVLVLTSAALWLPGCSTVIMESAKRTLEDRSTEDQVTDTKISAAILSGLSGKDKNLLLDINVDTWEQRVMLTGTVADNRTRQEVVQLARADRRVKAVYDEIQVVSTAEQARRREASKTKDSSQKEGIDRSVNDFWIETKISAKLIADTDVASINYRWRSVRNTVYLIGRARSGAEYRDVVNTMLTTEGVRSVKPFVDVRPVAK
jgi:osmotically-inducible protein OsmY